MSWIWEAEGMSEWVGVVLVLVGFLGSLVNALWARAERVRAERVRAGKSADLALEVQESMAASQATIAAAFTRPAVKFEVVPHGKRWALKNIGTGKATDVVIDWPTWCAPDTNVVMELGPDEGVTFWIHTRRFSEGRRTPSMLVTCRELETPVRVMLPVS